MAVAVVAVDGVEKVVVVGWQAGSIVEGGGGWHCHLMMLNIDVRTSTFIM